MKAKWQKTGPVADVIFTPEAGAVDYKDTVTLKCETPKSKIFYKFNDGEFVEYKNGTEIVIEKAATITAYATANRMTDSKPVFAKYTIKTYTVTFVSEKGSAPTKITGLKKNDTLTTDQLKLLDDVDDYFCTGWFDGETEAVAGNYKVTKDVTLKAKWQQKGNVEPVTFSRAAGAVDYKDTVTLNCATEGAKILYATDGKTFKEYKAGTKISIEKETTITAYATAEKMINSEQVSAAYTIKTYTVTFINGGHGTAPGEISGLKKNQTLTAEQLKHIEDADEHSCIGWYIGDEKIDSNYKITENITLTAKWEPWPAVKKVEFITKAGEVDYKKAVYLYCPTPNAKIHYKCGDGAEQIYDSNNPFEITKDITITAYATADRMKKGEDSVAEYTVKKYKVNFSIENKPEGLKDPDCDFVVKGGTVTNPNVYPDGKIVHWYKDGFEWDFDNDKIGTSDITLTGKLEYFTVEEVIKYFNDNKDNILPLTPVHIEYNSPGEFAGFMEKCRIPDNLNIYIYAKNPGEEFPQCIFEVDSNGYPVNDKLILINEFHIMGENIISLGERPFLSLQIKELYIESPIETFNCLYRIGDDGKSLKKVVFPPTLKSLGQFLGCSGLTTLTIPKSVEEFVGLESLAYGAKNQQYLYAFTSITFEDTDSEWQTYYFDGGTQIPGPIWKPDSDPNVNAEYFWNNQKYVKFIKIQK